jgi:anti-anti-sigma factor
VASYELERVESGDSDIAVVALSGELDLTNAEVVVDELYALASNASLLVVDLNRLLFIDSAAIHRLFQLAEARGRKGLAFVVDPGAAVAGTLQIVELDRAARVAATLDDAKA